LINQIIELHCVMMKGKGRKPSYIAREIMGVQLQKITKCFFYQINKYLYCP
jgi:hypothetical protein